MTAGSPATASLASYVPALLHERLASGRPFTGPEATRMQAAVMLTDIKGFTSLVDSFTSAGRAGLEELTWVLNAYFTDLVGLVDAHGGDVLYIAGDAFYCIWPADGPDALADAARRAAQAGVEIQAALDGRDVGRGHRFATRLGVGVGELVVAFAGGNAGRWELIATGDALRDVVAAEKGATPGHVVLSPAAWALVAAGCDGTLLPGGCAELRAVRLPVAPVPARRRPPLRDAESALRPFLPPAVLARGPATDTGWLAEQRNLTVMMADLPPLGDAAGGALERTHGAICAFQEVVRRFEGTIKVDVDDKGILMLAVFGLPPLAHEDDAGRAIHAARALRDALAALGVTGGIGIATGRAFCGAFGSDLRRDYMLRGDVINTAARLMQASVSDIVCEQGTMQATRGRIEFEALPPLMVRGRTQPLAVYRPTGRREHPARADAPMVGRAVERARLRQQLTAVQRGDDGGVAIVEAEAGLGKSRLVAAVAADAMASGVRVLTAAADAIDRTTAYYAWRPVFRAVFELTVDMDASAVRDRVAARMADLPTFVRLVPLLGAVLPVSIADNELTAEMTGDVRADNTRRLLVQILQEVASAGPTLLVLEDAHWLDSGSLALLVDVAQSVQPLATVVTTRPSTDPVPVAIGRLAQLAGDRRLRLDTLSRDEMVTLVAQRLGVRDLPAALVEFVHERAAGHPFFGEELIETLVESGAIVVADGTCTVGTLTGLNLPTTVEGVILTRLDRLAPGEQLCLKVASVIGRLFREGTVREAHPVESERAQVAAHLDVLAQHALTVQEAPPPDAAWLFKHVITRDVTYELMPLAQRQPLHRAVAEWYERAYVGALAPHYAVLAWHWARAADPARTVTYLELAGQQSLRGGAFREALVFFAQAVELHAGGGVDADAPRRALWAKGLGTAHYFLGDLAESRRSIEQAIALLDRPVPSGSLAVTAALLRAAARQVAHRLFPGRFLGRHARHKATLDETADCYTILGQVYYLIGEPAPRLAYLTVRGLNVGELAGESPALARILANMGTLTVLLGMKRWADFYARRAIQMAAREGQYAAAAYVRHINALKAATIGDWHAAKTANGEAIELIKTLGDYNLEAEAWIVRSTVHVCEGNFAAAPSAWRRVRELATRSGNAQLRCWSLLDEVDTLNGVGETDAAARVLDDALAIATAATDGSSTIDKQRAIAVTRHRQGQHAEAIAAADVVLDMIARQPPTGYYWVDYAASAVEVILATLEYGGDYASAHRDALQQGARRGCAMVRRLSRNFGNVRPRGWLLHGVLCRIDGDVAGALRAFRKADALATTMAMAFEQARAQLELGRQATGDARAHTLTAAAATFTRLGATSYAREAIAASGASAE